MQDGALDHEVVKEIIAELLEKLSISVDRIEIVATPAHPLFMVHTGQSGLLIGTHGDTLRSLNTLLKKIIERKIGREHTRFLLDVNNYHKRKIDELEKKSQVAAERVRLFKSEVSLEPMNAYERMIIHALYADDAEVTTESSGEGPYRHVVMKQRGATETKESFDEVEV